jgi:hypothetical protein
VVRRTLAALTGALALLAAGCGGGGGGGGGGNGSVPDAASVVPASAPILVAINSDFSSDQWQKVTALFHKFPDGNRLLAQAEKGLNGVRPSDFRTALGPEVDVALLDFTNGGNDAVVLTQPKDKAKLKALFAKSDQPPISEDVGSWIVLTNDRKKLDLFDQERKGGTLDGSGTFKDAMKAAPSDSEAIVYVNGQAVQTALEKALASSSGALKSLRSALGRLDSIVAWASARQNGVLIGGDVNGSFKSAPATYKPALPGELPAGALAVLSFAHLDKPLAQIYKAVESASPSFKSQLDQAEGLLGLSVEGDLLPIFSGEGALAVYPAPGKAAAGSAIPAIVFVQEVSDESKVRTLLTRLAAILTASGRVKATPTTAGGVSAEKLTFGRISVLAAVFDGKLVATNSVALIAELRSSGDRLSGDAFYKEAAAAAGMPSDVLGFLYLNLHAGLQTAFDLAEQSGSTVPKAARDNTAPLRSALLYSTTKSGGYRFGGFVTVK